MSTPSDRPSNDRGPPSTRRLRVVNFDIDGAAVAGRSERVLQERAWHLLAAYGADLTLVLEVERAAEPSWARDRWMFVEGGWPWCSVVAARPNLKLRAAKASRTSPALRSSP